MLIFCRYIKGECSQLARTAAASGAFKLCRKYGLRHAFFPKRRSMHHSFGYDLPVRFWRISDGLPVLPVIHQKCPRAVLAVHTRVARMMYELDRYCSGGAANRFIQRGGQESG